MGSVGDRAPPAPEPPRCSSAKSVLACTAPVDAVEQIRSGDFERSRQLGDGAHARLTLLALDLRDMGYMEIGAVRQAFLAQAELLPDATHVGGEDSERVGHRPTMLLHLSQLFQIQLGQKESSERIVLYDGDRMSNAQSEKAPVE
jgi:hypothetical protein